MIEEKEKKPTAPCRKCQRNLPFDKFNKAVDGGLIDSNGYLSVCKECINDLFSVEFTKSNSIEKAIHKLCVYLNIKYSEDCVESTKTHIQTQINNGTNHSPIFSVYKSKLTASIKSMDKKSEPMMYEDAGTVYITKVSEPEEIEIPKELKDFWGSNYSAEDIKYLETQFVNFKQTHKADTYAEITLLKEVVYKLLEIKKSRENERSTASSVKELQELMRNLAISPNASNNSPTSKGMDTFGLWIQEIEREEPAEWVKGDGKKFEIYRDVTNTEEYFQKYIVRPLKNFITSSKDFNIDDKDEEDDFLEFESENSEE